MVVLLGNNGKQKGLLFNTSVLTGSNFLARGLAYVYFWLIARSLPTDQVGVYALLTTVYLLMEVLANLGLDRLVVREMAKLQAGEARAIFRFSILVKIVLALATALIFAGVFRLVYPDILSHYAWELLCVLGAVFPLVISRSIEGHFTAVERMHIPAVSQLMERVVILIGAALVFHGSFGFRGFMVGFFLGAMVRMSILLCCYPWGGRQPSERLPRSRVRGLLKEAGQMALVEALALIYFRVDVFMLTKMVDLRATGIYQVAYKLFDFYIALFSGFLIAIFPTLARQGERFAIGRYLWLGVGAMVVVALPTIWLRRPILAFFQPEYVEAQGVLVFLMLTLPFIFWNSMLAQYALAVQRVHVLVRLAMVLLCLNVVLNYIAIPRFGIVGAAGTTLVCELILALLYVVLLKPAIFRPSAPGFKG